jgi:DNA-binding NarL/FixJ family response regulator
MPSVLLVENNVIFRQTVTGMLKSEFPDIEVLEACEGKEALRIVGESHPFLIFMDIRLPGENGLLLTKRIKSVYPKIEVAILTSYDLPEYRESAERSGAGHFFVKASSSFQEIFRTVRFLSKDAGDKKNPRYVSPHLSPSPTSAVGKP